MKLITILLLTVVMITGCIPATPSPLADSNQTIDRIVEVQPDVFVPLAKGASGDEIKAASALLLLGGGDSAVVACGADELHIVSQTLTSVSVDCVLYTPTPEPTLEPTLVPENTPIVAPTNTPRMTNTPVVVPTNTPRTTSVATNTPVVVPTDTPIPGATATNTPVVVPTNTPLPSAQIEPFVDGLPCGVHDPLQYHGLWNYELGCHYDHTHNVNPLSPEVVGLFGNYTEWTGTEISYPWQTFAGAMPGYPEPPVDVHWENDHKHAGYKFDFYNFPVEEYGCTAANPAAQFVPNAWLIERHSLGHKGDFMARVHSVWAMVRFCIPNSPGEEAWLYTGGWQDFGQRISPYQGNIIPVPGSPSPTYNPGSPPYIAHSCINHDDCRGPATESNTAWISFMQQIDGHRLFGFGFRSHDSQQKIDASGGFDTPDPTFVYLCNDGAGNYVAEGCEFNHSESHTYQLTGSIPAEYDLLDGLDDGRVNYEGFTDRWGNIAPGCTEIAMDCVPVKMVNLPVGFYHTNVTQYGLDGVHQSLPDYDIYFGDEPSGWIGPEN